MPREMPTASAAHGAGRDGVSAGREQPRVIGGMQRAAVQESRHAHAPHRQRLTQQRTLAAHAEAQIRKPGACVRLRSECTWARFGARPKDAPTITLVSLIAARRRGAVAPLRAASGVR